MKNFIVARHGSCDEHLKLNAVGETQIKQLAKEIKRVVCEGSILLLSSSAPRAIQSSQVLGGELGISFESLDELWSGDMHYENARLAMELILNKSRGFDHTVIMTHIEYTDSLPHLFARKELRRSDFYIYSLIKGAAWCINCKEQTCKYIQ